ncbi:calcium-translocating P-type ATPase [Coniochaeta ligniaria NRRL 30616]|uniref:Calcium-transporting ATPase n=1 Tax=Coniochaeta ligniaria NRRL 30616 TaxID=1408157 RepID=A0A1J7IVM8_9PEZI|nr:calcium-translocating P-type ATPase [Coniochaeta ligniaria NRRL 30616]
MSDPNPDGGAASTPTRRPRAPTITIDTVNASTPQPTETESHPHQATSTSPTSPTRDGLAPAAELMASDWTPSHQRSLSGQRPEVQAIRTSDSRDSRPTSPHNVSSPVQSRGNDRGFLSVPSNLRSRQNSVDSDDGQKSFTSSQGDTVVGSSAAGEKLGKLASGRGTDNATIMNDENALKPDQGNEDDFKVENNPFAYTPGMLNKMFNPKSLAAFYKMGGLAGFEKGLRTVTFEEATHRAHEKARDEGISEPKHSAAPSGPPPSGKHNETFIDRKRVFSDNRLPVKKGKSLLQLMWITYNDKVLILLSVAAVVSLAIGLYQTFGQPHPEGEAGVEWVEGVAIIVAIVIVVIVGSLNDYQKERQFAKLNKRKQDRLVKAIRSGKTIEISIFDILVGDVLHLEPGDMVPVDGILIQGFNVKCDESQATGESDIIKKRAADEVYAAIENHEDLKKMDPFIQSGARVMEGVGTFMVTSTGIYSSYGKTLMALNEDPEITPLQSKLNVIAEYIAKLGGAAGLLLFIVLFIKFLAQLPKMQGVTPAQKGQNFIEIFIVVVTIIVVAVPEGLPLAVTLALAFATTRMLKDNNLVRHLKACEVMGNATTICSDKTGTLTQNKMQVVSATVGTSHRCGAVTSTDGHSPDSPSEKDVTPQELVSSLGSSVKDLLLKSISLNSTAFEGELEGVKTFIGSKTETALLIFAQEFLGMGPINEERANAKILQLIPFDSGRKCMGVVVQMEDGKARLYVKGASEIMLEKCTQIIRDPSSDLSTTTLTDDNRETITNLIESYAMNSLRTIGIIYRDFASWPPRGARRVDGDRDEISFDDICRSMTFAGMVGIKDPLRPGVQEAVKDCQKAGVVVRMVTGDNKITAQAIAQDCGILTPNSIVMEGPEFRNLSKEKQIEIIPLLHVLARSSPEDKRILVKRLKDMGETVAVTGDGTNDAPALKMADVGFSMGIAGTEVAKEASAIILMDDNFNSIVKALKWGRAVNDAVKRFLQFQLTVNITAVVLTFVSAVSNNEESSVLTAVQLLWVNLIMDTLAALALATDPPVDSVLDRKPERKGSSIITTTMWKMILGQAVYQLLITFLIYFGAPGILPAYDPDVNRGEVQTLVFNTFVWMQIFNQWNNRRLDNKFNIFEGLTRNWFFIGISIIMVGGQVLIIMVGGRAFNIAPEKQTPAMWAYAIILGFLSIPVGIIIRLIPDSLVAKLVPGFIKRRAQPKVPGINVSDDEERFDQYPLALADVRDELAFMKRMKGGRINNLKFAIKNPRDFLPKSKSPSHSREHSRSNSTSLRIPQTPTREDSFGSHSPAPTPDSRKRSRSMRSRSNSALGAPTVMAGIVAGSIAAGWSPIDRRGEPDFGQFPKPSPSTKSSQDKDHSQPSQPSHLGSSVLGEHVVDEPQDIAEARASDVPTLSVPTPKKSVS